MRVSWLAQKWGGIIFTLSLISVLPLIYAIFTQYALWFDREAPPAIIQYIRKTQGIDIRVRHIDVDWFGGGLSLRDVELYDKLPHRPRIVYSPLVSVRGIAGDVISVKLLRPKITLIQGADKVWNIMRALPTKNKGKPGTKVVRVIVNNGEYIMELRHNRVKPAKLHVYNVTANVMNTSGITTFSVQSSLGSSRLNAIGTIGDPGVVVSYDIKQWPAACFKEFVSSSVLDTQDAKLDSVGRVWVGNDNVKVQGTGHVDALHMGLLLNNRMQSLGPISGDVSYDQQQVRLQARHALSGGVANTSVQIRWTPEFAVSGQLDCRGVNGALLAGKLGAASTIPQFGTTSGHVQFSYDRHDGLQIDGPLEFSGVRWAGYQGGQGKARIAYGDDTIRIQNGGFNFGRSKVRLVGSLPLKGAQMHLVASSDNLDLANVHLPKHAAILRGQAQVQAVINGVISKPKIELRIHATQVRYRQLVTRRVDAVVHADKERVNVRALWIKTRVGRVWASGVYKMRPQVVDAKFGIEGVPLLEVLKSTGINQTAEGSVFATGRISGKIAKPEFTARLMALDLKYKQWQLDMLSANARVKNGVLTLAQGTGRRTMGMTRWSGTVNGLYSKSPQANLQGYFSNWDISELAGMAAPDEPSDALPDGLVKAEVKIVGPVFDPSVTLRMTSNNITYDDLNLRDVVVDGAYGDKVFRIYQASGRLPDGELNASGVIRDAEDYRITGQFTGLALRVLRRYLPKQAPQDISGDAKAKFTLVARDDGPEFTAEVELSQMSWDGLSLKLANGSVSIVNQRIVIENLGANAYGGRVEAPLIQYDIPTRSLSSTVQIRDIDMTELSEAVVSGQWINKQWPDARKTIKDLQPLGGKISLITNVEGEIGKLDWYASLETNAMTVRGVDGLRSEVGLRIRQDGSIQVKPLSVTGKEVNLSGELQASNTGILSGRVELVDFNMKRIQVALPEGSEVDGVVNALAVIDGTTKSPSGNLVCSIDQPSWGGIKLRRISAESISLAGGSVDIPKVLIQLEGGEATLSGHLSLAPNSLSWTDTSTVDIKLVAPKQPLSTLTSLFTMPRDLGVKGEWQANINLFGNGAKPQLAGGLSVSDCTVSVNAGKLAFQKIAGTLGLDGQDVRLTNASAEPISGSGRIKLEAVIQGIFGKQPQVNSKLTLEQLYMDHRNLSGKFNERIRGSLDGSLEMKGSLQQPRISGQINATKVGLSLPNGFEFDKGKGKPGFDPFLDNIQLVIGNDTEIDLSRFKAKGGGRMSLFGKLSEPQLKGDYRLSQGRFILPTTVFRIEPPAVVSMVYPVPGEVPFNIDISMRATASVNVASNGINPSRHTVTMILQGSLEDASLLHSSFEASPADVSQSDIYDALGLGMIRNVVGGGGGDALGKGVVDLLSSQFVPRMLNPIESGLEGTFRLQEVRIDYQRDLPLSVMLVKQLGSGFSLSYWRQFDSQTDRYEAKMSYDLPRWLKMSPRLRLTVSTNEESIISYGLEGSLRF